MTSYSQALEILRRAAVPGKTETLPPADAQGCVAAHDLHSAIAVPSFHNSMMDGFAVRCADLHGTMPLTLPVTGTIMAGQMLPPGTPGTVYEIMTGAPVPDGYDAVVPVEDVDVTCHADGRPATVQFHHTPTPQHYIRAAGTDFAAGQLLVKAGERLHAGHIMALAATGTAHVAVRRMPTLHLLTTGDEVTEDFSAPLPPGTIYNANAPFLLARAREEGLSVTRHPHLGDDPALFAQTLAAIPAGSVILSTGAVSKGRSDFIPQALAAMGAVTHFHRVQTRPGRPTLFATLPDGSYYFGLPGNPMSAAIGLRFYVLPLLRAITGQPPEQPLMAALTHDYSNPSDYRLLLKATLTVDASGQLQATIDAGQESYKIHPLLTCNAWAVAEEGKREWHAGEPIAVFPFSMQNWPYSYGGEAEKWQAA